MLVGSGGAGAQGLPGTTYLFFDFGRPVLSRDAETALDDLVSALETMPQAAVVIAGYSDRAGSAAANMTISGKRAEAVRGYLRTKGVANARVRIVTYGESNLLIQTEDGVREAQNRRVEIRLVN